MKQFIKNILFKLPPYFKSFIPFYFCGKYYRKQIKFLKKFQNFSKQEKEEYQKNKIKEIFTEASKNKYYSSIGITKNLKLQDLKKIPFLTKEIAKKEDLTTLNKKKLKKSFTSGSTGIPLTIYRSNEENEHEAAVVDFLLLKSGVNIYKRVRILNIRQNRKEKIKKIGDILYIALSFINEKNLKEILKQIIEFNPQIIHAHPSVMTSFSKIILSQNSQLCINNLKVILLSSEILTEIDKKIIINTFNCKILDYYSNEENSICGYRIYPDMEYMEFLEEYSYIEIINKELVCTSLVAKSMPFIRYKTGDYITSNKLETVKNISGRTNEYLIDRYGQKIPIENFSTYEYKGIELYQFFQKENGVVEFRIKPLSKGKLNKKEIEKVLYKINNDINYEIKEVKEFKRTENNKHKILSEV